MQDLPAHVSPALSASDASTENIRDRHDSLSGGLNRPPPALLSPAFTPPSTPGTGTPAIERDALSIPLDTSAPLPAPNLLQSLPEVNCVVRARIPTTTGQEMFLHLYQNNVDNKEHLAIVFGPHIRSKSLDAPRPGETEKERMIRGAYTGRLFPGRTSSGFVPTSSTASPLAKSLHKPVQADHSNHTGTVKHPAATQTPLVRIHSECYTGETVWSARCDCGEQLDEAARLMSLPSAQSTGGVIVYLRQEGRGIGLSEKLKAYNLQDLGNDTVEANLLLRHPADARSYGLATAILVDLGLGSHSNSAPSTSNDGQATVNVSEPQVDGGKGIRLLTNNPDKVRAVEGPNREVIVRERVPMIPLAWRSSGARGVDSPEVGSYLKTKIEKMGHMLQNG